MHLKSWQDVDEAIKLIGLVQIKRDRLEGKLNERITAAKAEYGPPIEILDAQLATVTEQLEAWCAAHRAEMQEASKAGGLTWKGIFGKVAFRKCPPSVLFLKKTEKVLAALQAMRLSKFIRTTEEPAKDAMHLLSDEQLEAVGATRAPAEKFEVKPDYKQIAAKSEDAA